MFPAYIKTLKILIAAGALAAIGIGITATAIDEKRLPQSQEVPSDEVLQIAKRTALMCLDNPVERFFIRKIALQSIQVSENTKPLTQRPSENISRQGASLTMPHKPDLGTHMSYDATFTTYTIFAIPISTIQVKNAGKDFPGSCQKIKRS